MGDSQPPPYRMTELIGTTAFCKCDLKDELLCRLESRAYCLFLILLKQMIYSRDCRTIKFYFNQQIIVLRLLDFMTPDRPQIEQMPLGCCKVSKGQTVNSELLLSLLDYRAIVRIIP